MPPDRMLYYQMHPVAFVEDYILKNVEEISNQQIEILDAVVKTRRLSIRAGRGIGKTTVLSWMILWWMCCFSKPKVVATAPSFPQLMSVLWPELALWLKQSKIVDYFTLTATKFYLTEDPETSFAEPRTASKEESLQGLHATNLLLIMDEAPGIGDGIYEMIQGSLTRANNKIIQMGNPTRTSGFFYDSHHKFSHRWTNLHYSSEDSSLVDKEWLDDMLDKYGRTHQLYRVHVLGEFPTGDPDAFIALEDVDKAVARNVCPEEGDVVELGVDVARKGADQTVVAWRHGYKVYPLISRDKTTVPETVDLVKTTVKAARAKTGYMGVIRVKVDDTGLGCITKKTQVLTPSGWKFARELNIGDEIYSKNSVGNMCVEHVEKNVEREKTKIIKCGDYEFAWAHLLPYKTRTSHKFQMSNWEDVLKRKYVLFDNKISWEGDVICGCCDMLECGSNDELGICTDDTEEYFDNVHHITISGLTNLYYTRCGEFVQPFWTHNGGVTDYLDLDRDNNIEVIPCNFGGAGNADYYNEASVMWGSTKDHLGKMDLPDDRHLVEELSARRWDPASNGKICIEPKKIYKKHFGASPDRADALVLLFSNKKNERKVLKHFDVVGCEVVEERQQIGGNQYCALFYSQKLLVSAIWASWNGGTLVVTDEFVGGDTDVVDLIHLHAPYKKIIGNKLMFNKVGEDLYWQYSNSNIYIEESYNYDEFGAIRHLDTLTKAGAIHVNSECRETINQLGSWAITKSTVDLQEEYGLCYALCHIISELTDLNTPVLSTERKFFEPTVKTGFQVNNGFMSI